MALLTGGSGCGLRTPSAFQRSFVQVRCFSAIIGSEAVCCLSASTLCNISKMKKHIISNHHLTDFESGTPPTNQHSSSLSSRQQNENNSCQGILKSTKIKPETRKRKWKVFVCNILYTEIWFWTPRRLVLDSEIITKVSGTRA